MATKVSSSAESAGARVVKEADAVERLASELAAALNRLIEAGDEFRLALPSSIPPTELPSMILHAPTAQRLVQLRLFGLTAGKLRAGAVAMNPHDAAQRPRLSELAFEHVERALLLTRRAS